MILDKQDQSGSRCSDGQKSTAAAVNEEVTEDRHNSTSEVTALKEMLTQRDNEISILWHVAARIVWLSYCSFKLDSI